MTTRLVSWSELDSLRQCPMKHDLGYRQRWVGDNVSPALAKGSLWHAVLEAHYVAVMALQKAARFNVSHRPSLSHQAGAVAEAVKPLLYDSRGLQTETQELIEWMYRGYVEQYGLDDDWEIVAVEHAAQIWLPTPRGTRSSFRFKMKMDLIVRILVNNRPTLWVVDHKSCKDLPSQKMLELDDQFGLYTWGMRQLGKKILGTIHSSARTQRNKDPERHPQTLDSRFGRFLMQRTPAELDTLAVEAYKDFRAGYRVPSGEAPRHPNPDTCRWRCDYTEPCLGSRKGYNLVSHLESLRFHQDYTRH